MEQLGVLVESGHTDMKQVKGVALKIGEYSDGRVTTMSELEGIEVAVDPKLLTTSEK